MSSPRPPRPTRSVPQPPPPDPQTTLTPLRAHYLKKSLIQLQFHNELDAISAAPADNNTSTLAYLGPPFSPPPDGASPLALPFLRYFFRQFILTFPFMAAAPKNFYSEKLQPFVASVFAKNLSPTTLLDDPDQESPEITRLKMLAKVERNLTMLFASGTKLVEPEEVLRLTQADLDKINTTSKKSRPKQPFDVNIVSVRSVTDRGRVRSRVHDEFIIRTRLGRDTEVFVSRRYGDFRTLADELRKAHPGDIVPSPPAKDRTAVDVPYAPSPLTVDFPYSGLANENDNPSSESLQSPPIPGSFYPMLDSPGAAASSYGSVPPLASRLSREKNRLTLRAYLSTLLSTPPFSSSPVLRSFLLSGPTRLSPAEQEDAGRREEADRVREEGKVRFAREIGARVDGLRDAVRSVKGEVVGRDGLTRLFAIIKVTPDLRDLPENYQAVIEWARISLASTIFQTFVASDDSSETFASLKRIHKLMPYFVLKGVLKISNPVSMIRGVLDIFLAQPFGGRSLLQTMFTSSLYEEVKSLNTYIAHVSQKIDSPVLCEKVRLFVYAPREIQDMYKADASEQRVHLLQVVLRGGEEPLLGRALLERVERSARKWDQWMKEKERMGGKDDSDDEGPNDEEAWLFEDLRVLVKLYSRLRDREQLIALVFEGVTAELLKDIITIFYAPLAQVYGAASIADSLWDLKHFIDDLISTVEQTEYLAQSDPSQTVQAFIDLVSRHEQSFYSFVHKVHTKGSGLFDGLMQWIERFLTVVREGIGAGRHQGDEHARKISLETLLPAGGEERIRVLEEVDRVVRWHYMKKIAHEQKVRRRFGRAQGNGNGDAEAEDEATQALVRGVVGEIDFGELVHGDADELAAEETDEDDDTDETDETDEDSSEYETDTSGSYEESGEESIPQKSPSPPPPPRPRVPSIPTTSGLVRPGTIQATTHHQPHQPPPERPPAVRQRSFSLRSSKSMTFLRQDHTAVPPVPPVPPLPARFEKPLPPHPPGPSEIPSTTTRSTAHLPLPKASPERPLPAQPPPAPPRKSKKVQDIMQPPELKHIPQLLPIFVEMMRPLLRPQP